MAKLSLDDLRKLRAREKEKILMRMGQGKQVQIIVGMGTCGLAAGAKKTLITLINEVEQKKLMETVIVRQSGCLGHCSAEPTVEVIAPNMPKTYYGKVDEAFAKEIIQKHVIGKEVINDRVVKKA